MELGKYIEIEDEESKEITREWKRFPFRQPVVKEETEEEGAEAALEFQVPDKKEPTAQNIQEEIQLKEVKVYIFIILD